MFREENGPQMSTLNKCPMKRCQGRHGCVAGCSHAASKVNDSRSKATSQKAARPHPFLNSTSSGRRGSAPNLTLQEDITSHVSGASKKNTAPKRPHPFLEARKSSSEQMQRKSSSGLSSRASSNNSTYSDSTTDTTDSTPTNTSNSKLSVSIILNCMICEIVHSRLHPIHRATWSDQNHTLQPWRKRKLCKAAQ
eukprot:m.16055 g.16055  ORF g.16055 m.16055 type:complete len:194 (-) comp5576_c0_seq2:1054-1635(-)